MKSHILKSNMVQLLLIISTAFRGAPSKSTGTQLASMCLHERTGAFYVSSYQLGTRLFNAITRVFTINGFEIYLRFKERAIKLIAIYLP